MNLPRNDTNTGRVLRAMINTGWLTAGDVRRRAKLSPDTEVTARIRDLRKIGVYVAGVSEPHPKDEHRRLWKYRIVQLPGWVRKELNRESQRVLFGSRAA